jgi:TonB family protein
MKTTELLSRITVLVLASAIAFAQQSSEADQLDAQVAALYKQGQFDKAIPLAQRELALREKASGADDPSVGDVSRNLAELFFAKGKTKEANQAYGRFLQIYEKAFGTDSPRLVDALYRYVALLTISGQRAEAVDVQKRVFRLENGFDFDQLATQKSKNLVQGGLMAGLMTIGQAPVYTQEAKNGGVFGSVLMKITVDEKGQLTSFNVLSGHPLLNTTAEQAARRSTFAPARREGMPVAVTGILIYKFGMNVNDTGNNPVMRPTIEK